MKTFRQAVEAKAVDQKTLNPVEYAPGMGADINKNVRKRRQPTADEAFVPTGKKVQKIIQHESTNHLDKHIAAFSKGVKSSEAKHTRNVHSGKPLPNVKHVEADAGSHQKIFDHLKKMGYQKGKGHDPKPHTWNSRHDPDTQATKTDSVFHKSEAGTISAHIEHEHGGKPKVHFTHHNMKESMSEGTKGDRSNMAFVEKRAVKAAEKANVGAMARADKEAWVDQYIKDNAIPKGALGSAVYSGVMKVRAQKAVAEATDTGKTFRVQGSFALKDGGRGSVTHKIRSARDGAHARELANSKVNAKVYPDYKAHRATIHESVEELDEILNVSQRIKRGRDLKKNKAKLAMGKRRQAHRIADKDRLKDRAKRHARTAMVKRITKGVDKGDLSPQRRAEIERRLERMKGRIDVISRKILPQIRKDEIAKKRGNHNGDKKAAKPQVQV